MTKSLTDITLCISKELQDFENRFSQCLSDSEDKALDAVLRYAFGMKGKRVRPMLAMLVAGALGKITEQTMRGALIVELLHTASLLHDDVLDNSSKRRDQETINSIWGNHVAILTGDYLYGRALSLIKTQEDFNLMPVYAKIAMDLPKGEMSEVNATNDTDTSITTYLKVIYDKTASLIEASVLTGILSCKGDISQQDNIRELGKSIGIAFQIKDDMLDYSENTGKKAGIDIQEKKITLPLIYYMEQSSEEERERILEFIYSNDKTQAQIDEFVGKVANSGAMLKVEETLKEHSQRALDILNNLPKNQYTEALFDLVQYLIFRNK